MLKGNSRRPDILVVEENVSPVAIETEILPAITVEADATSRLGEQLRTTGRHILSSIAVRLPTRLASKNGNALKTELDNATDLEIAIYTGSEPTKFSRWPQSGWIEGSISDLSIFTQSASIIETICAKPLPVLWLSEMDQKRVKNYDGNLFKCDFIVDANLATKHGEPRAYRIMRLHDIIPDEE